MSYFATRLALFHEPGFTLHILNCLFSSIGFGMVFVSTAWIVVSQSSSVTSVAILMACTWIPTILLSPIIGVIVDRYDRRWLMAISNIVRFIVLVVTAIVYLYFNEVTYIYILALIMGVFNSLYMPAAFTLVRELVTPDKLLNTNATVDMSYEAGFMLGAASSGFAIAIFSDSTCLIINGIFFLLAGLCVMAIRLQPELKYVPEQRHNGVWQSFKDELVAGFKYLSERPTLQMLYIVQLLVFAEYQTAPILLSPFVKLVLEGEAHHYGVIEAALSVGALIGGMLLPYLALRNEKQVVILANLGGLIGFAVFAFLNDIMFACITYLILGIFMSVWAVMMTRAQEQTDMAYQGRMMSLFMSLGSVLVLMVYFFISIVSIYLSVRAIYIFEVLIAAVATYLSWRLYSKKVVAEG